MTVYWIQLEQEELEEDDYPTLSEYDLQLANSLGSSPLLLEWIPQECQ
jgi:hypothetical protein